jgi:OFA family oxalate/formate antiporter-like MFS transporter
LSYNASHRESKGTGKSFPVFVDEMTLSGPPVSYSDSPRRSRFFYGWWIAISAAIMHFFGGGTFYYGFTVFFNPIRESFGWNATVTSVAFTLQRLEGGIMGPIAGYMVDRFGPRRLMMAGWVVVGVGFILMSRISSLWGFYGTFVIIATGSSFASGMMSNVAIANWFNKKRSRALTTAFIGPGLCGLLVPVLASLNNRFGWQHTLFLIGIGLWLTVLPLSLVMRHRPEPYGYLPDGATTPAQPSDARVTGQRSINGLPAKLVLRTSSFWFLASGAFFQQIGTSAVMVHIVPYLESVNVQTTIAALAVTGMTLCSLIGRIGFGMLGDFANKRFLIAASLGLQAVGLFVFSTISADRLWLLILFLLTFGPGYGGPIPLRPALMADYFGTKNFGTIMGLSGVVSMAGGLVSPVLAGWIFDSTGSYQLAWTIFAFITLPAIPLMLLARPPARQRDT